MESKHISWGLIAIFVILIILMGLYSLAKCG